MNPALAYMCDKDLDALAHDVWKEQSARIEKNIQEGKYPTLNEEERVLLSNNKRAQLLIAYQKRNNHLPVMVAMKYTDFAFKQKESKT
jgi:hypothetical protein